MGTAAMLTMATGLTVARQLADPDEVTARDVSRTLIGGVLMTAGILLIDGRYPQVAGGFAALILITAVMVHGVALGQLAVRLVD